MFLVMNCDELFSTNQHHNKDHCFSQPLISTIEGPFHCVSVLVLDFNFPVTVKESSCCKISKVGHH